MLRHSIRVKTRLNDGEILQFKGKSLLLKSLLKYRHIIETHAKESGDLLTPALSVSFDIIAHYLIIGHLYHCRKGCQTLRKLLVADFHILLRGITRVGGCIILHKPSFKHLMGVSLKTLGINDLRVCDVVLQVKYICIFAAFGKSCQ